MISPKIYAKYTFPYERRFFERINALKKDYDFYTLLHICGNNTLITEKLMATGCDILEVDYQIDLAYYKKLAGNRVYLMGNLNPAGALIRGTPRELRRKHLRPWKRPEARGIFFWEVAAHTPVENLLALVRADHSRKPVP